MDSGPDIAAALPDLVLLLDEQGRCMEVCGGGRAQAARLEHVGRGVDEVFPPEIGAAALRAARAAVETREVQEFAYELDGRHFEARLAPCDGAVIVVARDVSLAHRQALEIVQTSRLEAVGRLAGGVAHDLNNMLTCVLAVSSAASYDATEPQLVADLRDIQSAARSGAELVARLLAFSRSLPIRPRVIDVDRTLAGLERMLARMLGERHPVEVETNAPGAHVRMDPSALEQVLMNLALNARDACPGGGVLRIRSSRVDAGGVRVEVVDAGTGMDADTLAHALEPFFTTKAEGRGTGLGLSSSHGLVTQAGGQLRLESELGRGTTAVIELPEVAAPPADDEALRVVSAPSPQRVLIVDDNAHVRDAVRRMLARLDFDVQVAESVAEAEDALAMSRPEVVLLDVVLPGRSGLELLPALRSAGIRVVLMSGFTAHQAGLTLRDGEFFLAKPFTIQELGEVLVSIR